jgi:hypothetical protein
MFPQFVAALRQFINQLIAEVPTHLTHEVADYLNEGRADKLDSALNQFLLAVIDLDYPKAQALFTPELASTEGVSKNFVAAQDVFKDITAFKHAPPQFNTLRTSCLLSGTIQHQGGRSSSYHIHLVRTPEELWHEWKISAFNFEAVPVSTPFIEAMNAVLQKNAALQKNAVSPQKAVAPRKATPLKKTGAGKKAVARKKGLPRKKALAQKKALPRKKAVTGKKAIAAKKAAPRKKKARS